MRPFLIFCLPAIALMAGCAEADEREGGAEQRALNEAAAELDEAAAPPPRLTEPR